MSFRCLAMQCPRCGSIKKRKSGVKQGKQNQMLDKKGNSNSGERIDLLDEFFEVFPEVEVAHLTGDREFLGQVWFEYSLEKANSNFASAFGKVTSLMTAANL